jgi:glutamyl-tRNA synthetase
MKVITRFAPSPTGMLHIGGVRTALFNYLFAKHHGGEYKLRIEDTDLKRNVEGGVEAIINGFKWLGIEHDGEIVMQSDNLQRHKDVVDELLKVGKAYYCYTSQEELAELRENAQKEGKVFKFISPWRDRGAGDVPEGVKPVIRIKAPLEGGLTIDDGVLGEVHVPSDALDDFVIMRSDGTPLYMLAVVVDDHDMGITHIIRGNEHFNNAFRQKILFDAMGWETPKFAHIPLIHGSDGKKLSKRHGATGVMEFKEMGYLPEAINNHLLRLGWSHGDDEIISMKQAIEWFNMESLQKSPARFEFDKLDSLNKHYIKEKPDEVLLELVFGEDLEGIDEVVKGRMLRAMSMIKERAVRLGDIRDACRIYADGHRAELDGKAKKVMQDGGREMLNVLVNEVFEGIAENDWTHENIMVKTKEFGEVKGWKMKDYTQAMRVAITFAVVSPGGIFEIMEILGKSECMERIHA